MCWCLHFSPLTGSICCSTIETVLDRLGVRDPGGFLHIWQRLALLPGESCPTGGWLCYGFQTLSARAFGNVWICLSVTFCLHMLFQFHHPHHHHQHFFLLLHCPQPLTDPYCALITPMASVQVTRFCFRLPEIETPRFYILC